MKNTTMTIKGIEDKALIGAIKAIVTANGGTITISEGSDQTTKTATKGKAKAATKGKAPKGVKVLKVDKYGNQWIAEYDAVAYAKKKAEMIADGTYDSKNRSKVYKELGWIL